MPIRPSLFLLALIVCMTRTESAESQDQPMGPLSDKDKIQYAIGVELVRNYKNHGIEINTAPLIRGITDAALGRPLQIPDKELRTILISVQSDIRRSQQSTASGSHHRKPLIQQPLSSSLLIHPTHMRNQQNRRTP